MSRRYLELEWVDLGAKVRAEMMNEANPAISDKVWATLPMETVAGHAVISGDTMWLATRIVHLGPSRMVKRAMGDVYFFASGQSISIAYGDTTESAKVNKFAQVVDCDIETLKRVGGYVLETTILNPRKQVVRVRIRGIEE